MHNLEGDAPAFLERAVSYHGLTRADVEQLRAMSEELANDALKAVNRKAMGRKKANRDGADADERMIFGVYFFHESRDDGPEDDG